LFAFCSVPQAALLARVAVPKTLCVLTAAPAPFRCIRPRRRSTALPKAGALPTALHPDIYSF